MRTIYEAKLLLIDDNPDLIQLLCEQLNHAGYTWIQTASNCEEARTAFSKQRPDCMILDINLPDGDGFSLFRELRAQADIPTLFLSARDADADRLFGLGLGADDYLLQRTYRAELRQSMSSPIQIGSRKILLSDALIQLPDGSTLSLTATERTILQKLIENRGHIVTYDALCEAVWGDGYYGYENSLNVHIRHLREKIGENVGKPQYLITMRGIGYKLTAAR